MPVKRALRKVVPYGRVSVEGTLVENARTLQAANRAMRLRSRRALLQSLAITGVFFVAEVVGGVLTGSLALLADAGHMLTDLGAASMAVLAAGLAFCPPDARRSWGYYRLEVLGLWPMASSCWGEHLKHQFGIDHATIQLEAPDFPDEAVHCVGDSRCLP